ncbi:STAS-like domain-containing protein [Aeromonas hydrophila]|uniref:STAS-like domain-containing protein n=1 Tax=Aeromonas hydrophila TaxID=644 RepID=UPI002B4A0A74|nr:STAS-like domain-containing protein [Aeromonas hydrophila]
MEIKVIDFSEFPGARYKRLGPYSGEEFRDDVLIPAIHSNHKVIVNFDGVFGYGSSFLEEVFGGLIRLGIDENVVRDIISSAISNDDPDVLSEIKSYVEDAVKIKHKE